MAKLGAALLAVALAGCGGTKNPCSGTGITTCPNPHPGGWARAGSTDFHGTHARLESGCVECHDQGTTSICVACHNSRGPGLAGIGGNPHPVGYSAITARADIPKNGGALVGGGIVIPCLGCHTDG